MAKMNWEAAARRDMMARMPDSEKIWLKRNQDPKPFRAKFNSGKCANCGQAIVQGVVVVRAAGKKWKHVQCEVAKTPAKTPAKKKKRQPNPARSTTRAMVLLDAKQDTQQ